MRRISCRLSVFILCAGVALTAAQASDPEVLAYLPFDVPAVVALPLHIDPRVHPQLTIVAWVLAAADSSDELAPQEVAGTAAQETTAAEAAETASTGPCEVGAYHVCGAGTSCPDGLQCIELRTESVGAGGSLCTRQCQVETDCGPSHGFTGACLALDAGLAACYQRCDAEGDCNYGTVCNPVILAGGMEDRVCIPVKQADVEVPWSGAADEPGGSGSLTIRLSWDNDPGAAFVGDTCAGAGVGGNVYRLFAAAGEEAAASPGNVACAAELEFEGLAAGSYVLEIAGDASGVYNWSTTCDGLVAESGGPALYQCDVYRDD